jgi:hypothetical protein
MRVIRLLLIILVSNYSFGQNTVGVLRNDNGAFNGYTLFTPLSSTETYLINNCGQIVHQWSSTFLPGNSVYLLGNGNLLRAGKIANSEITFGGVGGKIEMFDWDNNLLWEFTYSTSSLSQHHDIYPLLNGNILMLAVSTITENEAIQAGRNPALLSGGKLFNEQILELEPIMFTDQANIVWEWNIMDHVIQDFDATKSNFGVVADHPELLDINYLNTTTSNANWLHFNSVQYNAAFDQIVMSSRILSEIYIIDHSTTSIESASHSGGMYGKGGDILYRWGNVEAYDHGLSTDRTLFGQHFPHWIPDGLSDGGKIMIFNNGGNRMYSSIDIINPPTSSPGFYNYSSIDGYLPIIADWTYTAPNPADFVSAILSSAQRLSNGNTLICDGDSGYFFEIDSENNIVWEYVNPIASNGPLSQGDIPVLNNVFRAEKFALDYPAFSGKDLTPGDPLELNFDIDFCNLLNTPDQILPSQLKMFPNPTEDFLFIKTNLQIKKVEIYDVFGNLVIAIFNSKKLNIKALSSGIYFAKIYLDKHIVTKKIIKNN